MDEVDRLAIDLGRGLGIGVELGLGGSPVVVIGPGLGQAGQVVGRDAALPAGAGIDRRSTGSRESLVEVLDVSLGIAILKGVMSFDTVAFLRPI